MSKKIVYVASPVRYILTVCFDPKKASEIIIKLALDGCDRVKEAGHIPFSPVLAFNGVYDEFRERKTIEQACEEFLRRCDEIMVVNSRYTQYSEGIKKEVAFAKELGITQVEY